MRLFLLGLLDILQQAMGPEDNLDLAEITKQALEAGDESDVFGKNFVACKTGVFCASERWIFHRAAILD